MNASKLAIPALCVGLLGVVGGVAAANAFKPSEKPQQVQFVQPAAVTETPTVAVTSSTPTATATTATVKPVKVAVKSTPKATTTSVAPQTVQRQAVVSQTPTDPTPAPAGPIGPMKPPGQGKTLDPNANGPSPTAP
jgi:hypothetical protein